MDSIHLGSRDVCIYIYIRVERNFEAGEINYSGKKSFTDLIFPFIYMPLEIAGQKRFNLRRGFGIEIFSILSLSLFLRDLNKFTFKSVSITSDACLQISQIYRDLYLHF